MMRHVSDKSGMTSSEQQTTFTFDDIDRLLDDVFYVDPPAVQEVRGHQGGGGGLRGGLQGWIR